MFSLFRKEGSSQPVSQSELLAPSKVSASNSPSGESVRPEAPVLNQDRPDQLLQSATRTAALPPASIPLAIDPVVAATPNTRSISGSSSSNSWHPRG